MDVRAIKHAAKLSDWGERILACRSSGMPVKAWCEQNKVPIKSYYRWERLYMIEASSHQENTAIVPESAGQLIRVVPEQLRDEEESGCSVPTGTSTNVDITLRYGTASVEMPAGMGIAQIAALVKALAGTC